MAFIRYPLPESPEEFERMVCDAFEIIWGHQIRGTLLNMDGKRGNSQHGSDIFGEDRDGNPIAIQVKLISGGRLTANHVSKDFEKFQSHQMREKVKTYYIVTSGEQNQTEQHNIKQLAENYGMKVEIVYYDWIWNKLRNNPDIFKRYFPHLILPVVANFNETIKLTRPAISLAVQAQKLKFEARNRNGAAWIENRPIIAEFIETAGCFLAEEQTKNLQNRINAAWSALRSSNPFPDETVYRKFADEIDVLMISMIRSAMRKNLTLERCWVIGLRLGQLIGEYETVRWLKKNGFEHKRVSSWRYLRLVNTIKSVFPNIPHSLLRDWLRLRLNPAEYIFDTLIDHLLWTNDLISEPDEPKADNRIDPRL